MNEQSFNLITVILAIGAVVTPMFYGAVFLFMFRLFPSRKEIELQEMNQIMRHTENQKRFETIENDIKQLLNRPHEK